MTENTPSRNNIPSVLKGFLEKPDLGSFPNVSRVDADLVSNGELFLWRGQLQKTHMCK